MTTGTGSEDAARAAMVEGIMAGGQEYINRFLVTGIIANHDAIMDLKQNGCAQVCKPSRIETITPAAIGTGLMGVVIGALEYFRSKGG